LENGADELRVLLSRAFSETMRPRAKLLQPVTAAVNYEDMFKSLLALATSEKQANSIIKPRITAEIAWAKKAFNGNAAWMVWWLRWYKLASLHHWDYEGYEVTTKELNEYERKGKVNLSLNDLAVLDNRLAGYHTELEHLTSLPIPAIKNYRPQYEPVETVIRELQGFEKEWQESRKGIITPQEGDEVIIQFPDGWAWWLLPRESCTEEGKAMGHCGNAAGSPGDRLLSLRKKKGEDWHVSLTFVVRENGYLWEMKGRSNTKPADRYHPYIIKLLENDIVKGIDATGVHAPEENFEMTDLAEEEQEKLYAVKPTLLPLSLYFKKFGADDHFIQSILEYLNSKSRSTWTWNGEEFEGPTWKDLAELAEDQGGREAKRLLEYYNGDEQPDFTVSEKDMLDDLPSEEIEKIGVTLKAKYADQIQDWIERQEDYDPDDEDDVNGYYFDTTNVKEIISFAEMVGDPLIDTLRSAAQTGYETSFQKEVSHALEGWAEDSGFSPKDPNNKYDAWYRGIRPLDALELKEEEGDPDEIESDSRSLKSWEGGGDGFDRKAAIEAFHESYNVDKELTKALGEDGVKAFHDEKATAKRYKEEYRRVIDDLRAALKEATPEERQRVMGLDAEFKDGKYAPFVEWARTIVPDAFTFPEPEAEPKTSRLLQPVTASGPARSQYEDDINRLEFHVDLEETSPGDTWPRVVWERTATLQTHDLEQVGLADHRGEYPSLRALHTGDPNFWFQRLVNDYGRDPHAWVAKIKLIEGDLITDDVQFQNADVHGNKASSHILITTRTVLREGVDFEYTEELTEEDLPEHDPYDSGGGPGGWGSEDEDGDEDEDGENALD